MRIFGLLSTISLGLALLSGAAQAGTSFPAGVVGENGFQLFPRWQRVLSEGRHQTTTTRTEDPSHALTLVEPTSDDVVDSDATSVIETSLVLPQPSAYGPATPARLTPIPLARPVLRTSTQPRAPRSTHKPATTDCHSRGDCTLEDWQAIIRSAEMLSRIAQLEKINTWANSITYVDDLSNWTMSDYWQTPAEFIARGGDCEDYAITKYFGLVELGFPREDLRILVLFDEELQLHHSVLLVQLDGEVLVLDNQKSAVVSLSDVPHYRAIYSVNENNWWMHKTLAPVRLTVAQPVRISARNNFRRRLR